MDLRFVPLPGTGWTVLSQVAVRTTGLPARLLTDLSSADGTDATDRATFDAELRRTTRSLAAVARLRRFREALAWQNPAVLTMVDSLARAPEDGKRDKRRRAREYRAMRYLARYCGKTETIGFFGPLGWGVIARRPGHLRQRPGPDMIGIRRTFPEPWAVRAVAAALREDDAIRPWLPLRLGTHYSVHGNRLRRPRQAAVTLSDVEAALVAACDGVRPRCVAVAGVAEKLDLDPAQVQACADQLVRRRVLMADANLPLDPTCLSILDQRLAAIDDAEVASAARATVASFLAAVRALAEAHGDADRVAAAQGDLAAVFEGMTGDVASRRGGRMYAGRGLAYEECQRDLAVELGDDLLARIGEGLGPILTICQWLTFRTRLAYEEYFARVWGDGRQDRYLDEVWFDVLAAFFATTKPRPIDAVLTELARRWGLLVGQLRQASGGWSFPADEFRRATEALFGSPGPGWPRGRVHSPDLQVAAHTANGTATGEYTVVLGEIHIGAPTIGGPVFEWPFDRYVISEFLRERVGGSILPVFPETWPRNTGRTMPVLSHPRDVRYAFADTEGALPGTVSICDVRLDVRDGTVSAVLPDGDRFGFGDFFAAFLTGVTIDAWKSVLTGSHTPRISVGPVVITREAWRVDVSGEPFARLTDEHAAYVAVDEWRTRLGLPDRVYVKLADEVKPFYVDFSAPICVLSFLAALRPALRRPPGSATITVSEALPGPDHAWVLDADGERYLGELRLVMMSR